MFNAMPAYLMNITQGLYAACAFIFVTCAALFSLPAAAVTVQAEGYATIYNNDIGDARVRAIRAASEQAMLQSSVYVSTSTHVQNNILTLDNSGIATLGRLDNIKVLKETINGQQLQVVIQADVETDQGCENGVTNQYQKSVTITAFPMLHPGQSNLGGIGDITWELPNALASRLQRDQKVLPYKATKLNLYPSIVTAASRQLDDGTLTSVAQNAHQLGSQFIISGVIRDLSMIDPNIHNEKNYFKHLYNKLNFKSDRYQRQLSLDVFLHDGYSGALLKETRYETTGMWNLNTSTKTGFNSATFREQGYGQKIAALVEQMAADLEADLGCRPFTAPIIYAQGHHIWFDAGDTSGISVGDRFTVMHRSEMYQGYSQFSQQVANTQRTLVVDEVQPNAIRGTLSNVVNQQNILPGDIVTAH
ncbi:MAG: flagellar assembly protein T N-terminal domain-containing protein [Pontibacterium sp.]